MDRSLVIVPDTLVAYLDLTVSSVEVDPRAYVHFFDLAPVATKISSVSQLLYWSAVLSLGLSFGF